MKKLFIVLLIIISGEYYIHNMNPVKYNLIKKVGLINYFYYRDYAEYIKSNEDEPVLKVKQDINNKQKEICYYDRELYLRLKKENKLNNITKIDCEIALYKRIIETDKSLRLKFNCEKRILKIFNKSINLEIFKSMPFLYYQCEKQYNKSFFKVMNDLNYMSGITRFNNSITFVLLLQKKWYNNHYFFKIIEEEMKEFYLVKNRKLHPGMLKRFNQNINILFNERY